MTDPNIVKFIDEHCVKTGEIEVKDIRDYGEVGIFVPVYNGTSEFSPNATAVLYLEFDWDGEDATIYHFPKHLLSDDDLAKVQEEIADFFYEKEAPSIALREALQLRLERPYAKQNTYFAWRKPDDTLFMIGMESYQAYHILKYEYDTYLKSYGSALYNIDPHAPHMRGPQKFDPLEELVSKVKHYEYLGSWNDPEVFMDQGNGKVAACGRWELARVNICGEGRMPRLDEKIGQARALSLQESLLDEGRGETLFAR